ncbi:MAG: general secretion pathway protein GspK [Bacteriovoracaceae bacterium]
MNNKRFDFFTKIKDERGVAILMVLSAVTLLTAILSDFVFETKLNKLKTYNSQDKYQSRLNAESGLRFAMARLKMYQEAFNMIQKNEAAKGRIKQEDLNLIWNIPFVYPIPQTKDVSIIQRSAIEEFEKNTVLQGELKLEIINASQLLNVNILKISSLVEKKKPQSGDSTSTDTEGEPDKEFTLDSQLVTMLKEGIEKKRESDEDFNNRYADKDALELIGAIKHYVSDQDSYEDPYTQSLNANYASHDVIAKHAPLSSLSEMYLIDGWDDQIVDLISNELTVHGAVLIDLNKITNKTLKILLPSLDEEQVKEFFKYRDDPKDPKFFNTLDDFKKYVVGTANFMTEGAFSERMKKFEQAGLKFGAAGTLFKVMSTGSYNRASYTLTAFVTIPAKPVPPPAKKKAVDPNSSGQDDKLDKDKEDTDAGSTGDKKKVTPIELLHPRVVEVTAN